ncbi:MAG: hypothetical protein NUK54_03140 [Methanothrix sp.]|nr:hypothetical protein [Methanothrix sp.]
MSAAEENNEKIADAPAPTVGTGLSAMFLRWNVMGSVAANNRSRAPIV